MVRHLKTHRKEATHQGHVWGCIQLVSCNKSSVRLSCEFLNFPHQVCKVFLMKSFYVDDYVCGAASLGDSPKLQKDVTRTLVSVGMQIWKWASSNAVMAGIPPELRENNNFLFRS